MLLTAHETSHPKHLGAFYTPATIAGILAGWVVCSGTERLLEPSVGQGALLDAAVARASAITGNGCAVRFLACDIDPQAVEAILPKLPEGSEARAIDFLQLDVASTGTFQGIIANPPFTRNHALSPKRRAVLRERFEVTGAAGLWVHFLFHAVDFLAPGGRLAAIVPAAALFTRYGRAALERIASRFGTVEVHQIVDRPLWVNGADERGAIILCAGYLQGSSALPAAVPWSNGHVASPLNEDAELIFCRLANRSSPLSSLAIMRIGAVTGCNAVFLMTEAERSAFGISRSDVLPIAARARHISGLSIGSDDIGALAVEGERTWLLRPRTLGDRSSAVRRRLAQISASRRRRTLWLNKRTPWWRVDVGKSPDAIFTYMNDHGPRLVLTADPLYATNTLHQVHFNSNVSHQQKLAAALSMVSSFGQLAAERLGRSYGGGVIKFELCEARLLPILPAHAEELDLPFLEADYAFRLGDREAARGIADEALIAPLLGNAWRSSIVPMITELEHRRSIRHGRRS